MGDLILGIVHVVLPFTGGKELIVFYNPIVHGLAAMNAQS